MREGRATLFISAIIFFSAFTPAYAQFGLSSEPQWGGYLLTDNRVLLDDRLLYSWYEHRLDLQIDNSPTDRLHFYSEIWVRTLGFPTLANSQQLMDVKNICNWDLCLREAYLDIYEFLSPQMDVRIGRQRIAWGAAKELNPTDNLNPDDLEDIWDFGRHLSSDGIRLSLYLSKSTIEAVFIPRFTPAALPRGEWSSALTPDFELPEGLVLRNLTDEIRMSNNNIKNSFISGLKISRRIGGFGFSASYVYGREDLPVPCRNTITPVGFGPEIDLHTELAYPRVHIGGIDVAGTVYGIGIWGEAAVFLPEEVLMITDLGLLGMGIQESVALKDEPYVKYVLGLDYTFRNGMYINFQYLHGFIHEMGKDALGDYFMFGTKWSLFHDTFEIMPLVGGIEIRDYRDVSNNFAVILSPEVTYKPVDNVEISAGVHWIDGKSTTTFGKMNDSDEFFCRLKYSF